MKLSRKWLSEFTDIQASPKEYEEKMTMSGSKVEITEELGAEISNVVVGRVTDIRRHENSDHLFVCTVDVGRGSPLTIVTGAQNVSAGDMVPVALDNSTLPGGVKITKGSLRGVESEGMLCSLKELGLTVNDFPYAIEDGIFIMQEDCSVGDDIHHVLGLDDSVVEFEITNNRPDCFSIRGLARESAVTFGTELRLPVPKVKGSDGDISEFLDVEIWDSELCPRYTARVVKNIKIEPSPKWMRERLRASGVRPINNIVDITNYVMLEYGQPMHAFDYACVSGGKIIVRSAFENEKLITLDGASHDLTPDMLVIADETRAVGLAGVMGGENSEITDDTKMVVFESANFNGVSIRKTAIALGMRTDASSRFEKGLDPLGTLPAVERACELVELLGAGEVVGGVIDVIASDSAPVTLKLEPEKINALLGTNIDRSFMEKVLIDLGFTIDGDIITVPSWRSDIQHYSDIAEEVARFYGYNVIEPTALHGVSVNGGLNETQLLEREAGELCRSLGFTEIMTYSFIGHVLNDKVLMPEDSPLRKGFVIQNPLGEDTSFMRTSTLPTMLDTLERNNSYRNRNVRVYELARTYLPKENDDLANERNILTLGAYGDTDFYSFKGCIESLLDSLRIKDVEFKAETNAFAYHPGRCAAVYAGGSRIGIMGQLHPTVCSNFGMDFPVLAAELDFGYMLENRSPEATYTPLPRFPSVLRDLSVVCDIEIPVADIEACIRSSGSELLCGITFFDVYTGAPIPAGRKSTSFSLEFRSDDHSLTDADVDLQMNNILKQLADELNAQIR